jgi:Eco57I restriction-modification methylase
VDYLSHKLTETRQRYGEDQFYSFYRHFLLRLFHEGLGRRERPSELEQLLGNVPYLNGGLFDVHQLEQHYPDIQIADEAFERIFAFFDDYRWHLDERPLRNDREINPDVLGYIFEKYINQKQMGAYYTKEDITGYISKSTVIPCLLEATAQKCSIAFTPDGFAWSLVRRDPDRYIYEAVKHGCDLPLPPEIEAGIHDVSQRGEWNKPAPEAYALPTEIWREVVARHTRYEEVRAKLASGTITNFNDLIAYNLDMGQFAQDAIAYSEGVDLLNAFYASLETITILDPTCGSGAFLFAALNILEPLYEACLDRMQEMVAERDQLEALETRRRAASPGSYIPRFRDILAQVAKHPNRRYFILKSIIINNLYGVDIMEEAVEICKLRLFLKLVAQIEHFADIEPLPDIDFNIRAGNSLVGFASYEETKRAIEGKTVGKAFQNQMIFDDRLERIEQKAQEIERAFEQFRELQTKQDLEPADVAAHKRQLQQMLVMLRRELDSYLASEYGIDRNSIPKREEYDARFSQWQQSHQPFHWWMEFYGIMMRGGFDVIIGNPPYVEYGKVQATYQILDFKTESCGNLYAFILERSTNLLYGTGRVGFIVPISFTAAQRMKPLQDIFLNEDSVVHLSNFALRPAALFPGVMQRLTIMLYNKRRQSSNVFTTDYLTWYTEERDTLLHSFALFDISKIKRLYSIPKINDQHRYSAFIRILKSGSRISYKDFKGDFEIYYHNAGGYWIKTFDFRPYYRSLTRPGKQHTTISVLSLPTKDLATLYLSILNSSLFYFFWKSMTDARHIYPSDIAMLPIKFPFPESLLTKLRYLQSELMEAYRKNSERIVYGDAEVDQFRIAPCKPIIDEIDRVLARHYGFTDEELDFIINYDIKYRMGRSNEEDEGE